MEISNKKFVLPASVDPQLKKRSASDSGSKSSFSDAMEIIADGPEPAPPKPSPKNEPAPRSAIGDRAEVPDSWKHPTGPYRQAPPEYGGGWWYTSPFAGQEPWKRAEAKLTTPTTGPDAPRSASNLPPGFAQVFGEKPMGPQYKNYREYQTAKARWEQDLRLFKQAGTPPGVSSKQLEDIAKTAKAWGMGEPQFYEGRYGWKARFPDSALPDHEVSIESLTMGMHQMIARYQIKCVHNGIEPAERHPFVPPGVWLKTEDHS
jgi:hypothetical protein